MEGLRDDNKLQLFYEITSVHLEIIASWGTFICCISEINKSRNISFENKAEILCEIT